jgi:hypothetical protein
VPSWLVSLVIHLLFFIALGLLTLPELLDTAPTTLTAALAEEIAIDTLQEIAIAPPLENSQEHVFQAPAGEMSDLANMTDEAAVGDGSGSYIAADVDAVEIGELDEAFGGRGQGLKTVGGMGGGAEFFGVKAGGKRFVFVVDSSNSMRGEKFEDAKEELVYAIRRLDKKQMFYVIFFDQDALRMFTAEGTNGEPEPRPVFATTQNINKLEKWLKDVDLEGRTNPYDAMKFAVELLPDAIYLLSDGQFTDRGRTEDYLRANNILDDPAEGYRPKVVIHTIGFYSKEGEVTLQAIAKAYQGTYRFVAPKPARARRR